MRFAGLRSVARNSAYLLGGQALSILLRAIHVFILVRALAPADYGILNYALSWYLSFIAFTYLGLEVVLSREIGRSRTAVPQLAGATLALRSGAIVIVTFVSIGSALALGTDTITLQLIVILALALVGRSVWLWSASLFTALEEAPLVMRVDLLVRPLELLVLLGYLGLIGPDLVGIASIHALSWCLQGGIGLAIARRRTAFDFSTTQQGALKLLVQGLPGSFYALGMAWFFQLPVLLFGQLEGMGATLGFFALSFQLVGYVQIVPTVIGGAALPVLSRSAARADGKDRLVALALILLVPAGGALIAISGAWWSEPLMSFVFGAPYAPAGDIFAAALWLLIPMCLAVLLQQFVFSSAFRSILGALSPLLGVAAMSACFPLLPGWLDYRGAILAIFIGMSVWVVGTATALIRSGFFSPRASPLPGTVR